MKYIYDIILNFNETIYEFYEWKDNDSVEYIKKIPIFKVDNKVLDDLYNNKISIDLDFLKSIYNKCEVYTNFGIKKIEYACLFCSDECIFAIEFNENGLSMFKSDLMIDESIDILNSVRKLKIYDLDYKIVSKCKISFVTRKEVLMIKFIKRELNSIYNNQNVDKLKYIYYECFGKFEGNMSKIILDLDKYICKYSNKLFNLLMLNYSKGLQK